MELVDRMRIANDEREVFTGWLGTLPGYRQGSFTKALYTAEMRLMGGTLEPEEFSGIVRELCRDMRGTCTELRRAAGMRTASGHRSGV